MSLTSNNNQKGKGGNKNLKNNAGSKFIGKPVKGAGISKKPIRTGGTRGS
jgi:hypothetical protein